MMFSTQTPAKGLALAGGLLSLALLSTSAAHAAPSSNPNTPTQLTATVKTVQGKPDVRLTWTDGVSPTSYKLFRDGAVIANTHPPDFDDTRVTPGATYTYSVNCYVQNEGDSAHSKTVTVTVPKSTGGGGGTGGGTGGGGSTGGGHGLPQTPAGVVAVPQWMPSCVHCGGTPMPHVILSWNPTNGALSYCVFRSGVLLHSAVAATSFTDMDVTSGTAYSYTVCAVNAVGDGAQSASAAAVAPFPPVGAGAGGGVAGIGSSVPTNLAVHGVWQSGQPTDMLTWDAVQGAVSYNVYQYSELIGTATAPSAALTVPLGVYFSGAPYTVTAVDAQGQESLPSNLARALGSRDPSHAPTGWTPPPPVVPTRLTAMPQWNAGGPRVFLAWLGARYNATYNIYRDGVKVADGLWDLTYIDNAVKPGETHTYTATAVNVPWVTPAESAQSASVRVTTPTAAPAALAQKVQIVGVVPNDDSVLVEFAAVPGAVDYRCHSVSNPNAIKYSGGSLSIEMNGLGPAAGADLVVEAVDKFGPFQTMDGMAGPGAMEMDGTTHQAINGQGDPSNVPNVLASSDPVHVNCQPAGLTGEQAFFDTFRDEQPLVPLPLPTAAEMAQAFGAEPQTQYYYGSPREYRACANDKWEFRAYEADIVHTSVFFMGNHFMDTLYDGGAPHSGDPMHTLNATMVMMPKVTQDISGGKVLHVTFEVDPHFSSRRWCDVYVAPAEDTLLEPGKFAESGRLPTTSGRMFRWEIKDNVHDAEIFSGRNAAGVMQSVDLFDQVSGQNRACTLPTARILYHGTEAVNNNGGMPDLDKRSRFDLYLSQTHVRIYETRAGQQPLLVKDSDFPNGATLPFTDCQVYLAHQVYHTDNDRPGMVEGATMPNAGPAQTYWYDYRPFCDERHWDNCGFEVLSGFPQ